MSRPAVVALAGVAVLLAGCSDRATLDHSAAERAVSRAVAARVRPRVRSATCPVDIRQRKAEVSRCSVLLRGVGRVRVLVRQVDGDGHLSVTLQDAVLANRSVARDLEARLAASFGRSFTADCGGGSRVVAPGKTFRCRADDGNSGRLVTVTVEDPAGTLTYDVST